MSENNMKENTNINEGETVEKAVVEGENVSTTISTDSNETSNEAIPEETVNTEASDDEIKKIKKIKRKARLQGAICSLLIMIVILGAAGYYVASRMNFNYYKNYIGLISNKEDLLGEDSYNKINGLYDVIESSFLFDYEKEAVIDGMYKGMFEALGDIYSCYYTEEEFTEMMESGNGSFEGIGAYLSVDENSNYIIIVAPISDSPADKVGVMKNDLVVEVDGEDMANRDSDYVASKIRGPKGTSVHVKVKRGEEFVDFDIVRDKINEVSVESKVLEDNIGYIYISSFDDDTNVEFEKQLKSLTDQNINSLIIDLRSNGGGYVDTATDAADQILGKCNIVTITNRDGKSQEYNSDAERKLDLPIVILVDGNTASAAEIFTAALSDNGVATTVGTLTFGKGIVQDILDLPDGSGLKITSAEYYTPDGECIHKKGIEPDIVVEFDSEKYIESNKEYDSQLEKAKEVIKEKLK